MILSLESFFPKEKKHSFINEKQRIKHREKKHINRLHRPTIEERKTRVFIPAEYTG